jgi:Fic family protein
LLYENAEIPGVPLDDVQEVSNYVAALNHGLKRMRDGFPLSLRLIREIHEVLLAKGRGSQAQPGQFRKSQNWIGGSRPGNAAYVPPPPEYVADCMGQLETFIHQEGTTLPLLIKAGLVHAQFESIHPYLDGNGRVGRLLITFMLCAEEVLREPVLYLSLFFKKHRRLYYDRLNETRESEGWTAWLDFCGAPQIRRPGLPATLTDSSTQTRKRLSASAAVRLPRSSSTGTLRPTHSSRSETQHAKRR